MYLIATETAPNITTANKYYNELLYHRGLPSEALTQANMNKHLLAEYAKEFIGEGQLFYAYKRLNNKIVPILQRGIEKPEAVYVIPLPKENTYFIQQ